MFSKNALEKFDYVFTDAMTWTGDEPPWWVVGLITVLGLIWAVGCTSNSSGPSEGGPSYTADLSIEPPTLHNGVEFGNVICIVRNPNGDRYNGGWLHFTTKAGVPWSSITSLAKTNDTLLQSQA